MSAPGHNTQHEFTPAPEVSVAVIMLFQVSALIIRSFAQIEMADAGYFEDVAYYFTSLIGFAVLGLFMWPIMARVWPAVREQFATPQSWPRMIAASLGLGIVLWLAQALALLMIAPLVWIDQGPFKYTSWPIYAIGCERPLILLLAIPVMSVLTPVVEEVISRGLILRALLPKGPVSAILLSAALFAILHKFAGIPNAFVFGIFVGVQMIYYRTLWAVVITHSMVNFLAVVGQVCLEGYWPPGKISAGILSPAPVIIVSFAACLAVAGWLASRSKAGVAIPVSHPG